MATQTQLLPYATDEGLDKIERVATRRIAYEVLHKNRKHMLDYYQNTLDLVDSERERRTPSVTTQGV